MSSDLLKEIISNIELTSIKTDDLQVLGDILEETICNSASVFSMLTNDNIELSIVDIQEATNIQNLSKDLQNSISAEINYEAGIEGASVFFFETKLVSDFANTVMGAPVEDNSTIGELQLSAFGEIITQFTSKITSNLTKYLEIKIGALSPAIKIQNNEELDVFSQIENTPVLLIKYNISFSEKPDCHLYQVISINLAKDVIEKFKEAKIPNYSMMQGYTKNQSAYSQEIESENPLNSTVTVQPVKFSSFDSAPQVINDGKNLDLLMDIKLKLTVELGRTEMPIGKVLELSRGSVIELDKIAGEPVELYANGKLIANGEVVVIEDNFGLRITNILSPDNRLKNL